MGSAPALFDCGARRPHFSVTAPRKGRVSFPEEVAEEDGGQEEDQTGENV